MKTLKLLIVLFLALSSCIDESINSVCVKRYNIPKWNMSCTSKISIVFKDANLNEIDVIYIQIMSDDSIYYDFNNYIINNNTITLYSSNQFQNNDFDDYINRGFIDLITEH